MQYEDEVAQALALSVLPLDELHVEAADQAQLCTELGIDTCTDQQAAFGQALLDWFKSKFFSWVCPACQLRCAQATREPPDSMSTCHQVNAPPCASCGSAHTRLQGMVRHLILCSHDQQDQSHRYKLM